MSRRRDAVVDFGGDAVGVTRETHRSPSAARIARKWALVSTLGAPLGATLGTALAPAPALAEPVAPPGPDRPALELGGYVQPGFQVQRNTRYTSADGRDVDGFVLRNARLNARGERPLPGTDGAVTTAFKAEAELGSGAFEVKDIFGTVALKLPELGRLVLDVGQFKVPFSLLESVGEAHLQLPDQADLKRLTWGRDRGMRLSASGDLGPVWLQATYALLNGEGPSFKDNQDDHFLQAARLEVAPFGKLPEAENDLAAEPRFRMAVAGSWSGTASNGRKGDLTDALAKETRYGADLRLLGWGGSISGEFVGASVTPKNTAKHGRQGYRVQGGYLIPGLSALSPLKIEVVARYSVADLNDKSDGSGAGNAVIAIEDNVKKSVFDAGVNLYFDDDRAKLQLVRRQTDLLEGRKTDSAGDPLIGDAFVASLQLGWL